MRLSLAHVHVSNDPRCRCRSYRLPTPVQAALKKDSEEELEKGMMLNPDTLAASLQPNVRTQVDQALNLNRVIQVRVFSSKNGD